jgi:curved DNA-binding protein CbpA
VTKSGHDVRSNKGVQAPMDDFYALLGVDVNADGEELRRAWRRLVLQWHPDRAGVQATARFQQLSAAYDVLSDPLARRSYDRRRQVREAARPGAPPPAPPPPVRRKAPGVMLSRQTGPLASLLACGIARRDASGLISLTFNAAEAAQGGMVMVCLPIELRCPECAPRENPACERCEGRRTVRELYSAWLAVRPGVADGEVLAPSVELRGTITPVRFRVCISRPR